MVCGGRGGERAGVRGDEPGKMGRVVQVEGGGGEVRKPVKGESYQPAREEAAAGCLCVCNR